MAVDAGIYSLNQPVKQANPLAQLAQAYQVQGLAAESQQAQRALQQEDALSGAYQQALGPDGKLNRNALLSSVAGAGLGAKIPALQKGFNEQDKSAREAEKAELEGVIQKFDVGSRIMSTYDPANPQTWQGVIQQTAQYLGADAAARLPMQPPTVEQIQQNMNRAMSAKDLAEQKYKALTLDSQRRGQDITMRGQDLTAQTSRANNEATVGAAMRGQDLTDARSREANVSGRVPSGYRQLADGSLEFIPGGPADPASKAGGGKPLTEGQSKALLFGTRMQEANQTFDDLAATGTNRPGLIKESASKIPFVGGLAGAAANVTQSTAQQRVEQAQRDFINATLRRESGAAIAESEFDNARKQYFPQVGDSKEVIEQKRRNRELSTRGFLAEVPESERRVAEIRNPGGASSSAATGRPAAAGGMAAPKSKAEFDSLPSGTLFTAPDGTTRRKP